MSNRSEIVTKIANTLGITKRAADMMYLAVTDAIVEQLEDRGQAVLPRFGRFRIVERRARQGRNPRTGESISIPAKEVVTFKTFSG